MNHTEAAILVRYVRALCPQQKFDEYSADAWHDLLADLELPACKEACAELARRQPFIAPAEVIAEVRAQRRDRLANFQYDPDPDESPREYLRRLRAQIADVADGRRPAELPLTGTPSPELRQILGNVGRPVPNPNGER